MIRGALVLAFAFLGGASGCNLDGSGLQMPPDLAAGVGPDAAVPVDGSGIGDLAVPPDLARPLHPTGWPMEGHDPQHTARVDVSGPAHGVFGWSAGQGVEWPPVIGTDGTIYATASGGGGVLAISPTNGATVWTLVGALGPLALGPANVLYAIGFGAPQLCSWGLSTQKQRWCSPLPSAAQALTVAEDGTVIASFQNAVEALAAGDGHTLWQVAVPRTARAAAVGLDGNVIVVTSSSEVSSHKIADGSRAWTVQRQNPLFGPVIGQDGSIYVFEVADYARLVALDPADGHERWAYSTAFGEAPGPPAIAADGSIRLAVAPNFLFSITSDGKMAWRFMSTHMGVGAPIVDRDGVTYLTAGTFVFAVDASGQQRWELGGQANFGSQGVIGPGGQVYVVDDSPALRAIGP